MPMNAPIARRANCRRDFGVSAARRALLLPRGQSAAQRFRTALSRDVDDALADTHRLRHDPARYAHPGPDERPNLYKIGCAGRITQLGRDRDGRYLVELTGVARFRIVDEPSVLNPYRQCKVDYHPLADDLVARKGEDAVDRDALLKDLGGIPESQQLNADGKHRDAPNEALVNALAMMSPYGPAEQEAMLEAADLRTRAEILVALTEIELARSESDGETKLQ